MSSAIIAALDEVRGRCITLKVQFPDTCAGVEPAIDKLDVFLRKATKGTFSVYHEQDLAETLWGVKTYCDWLQKEYPEANAETKPLANLINRLVTTQGDDL